MDIPLLEQRAIEASIFKALYQALKEKNGRKAALETVETAARSMAVQAGLSFAAKAPDGPSFEHFKTVLDMWRGSGALDIEDVRSGKDELTFTVTRCGYVEKYREMGLPEELAGLISCCRDEPFAQAYSNRIFMERPETIGSGADCCRFRFTWKD
ncbi:MAG: L-2-amino-thiazoline-4-carboxylic acid hydrolase [Desulfovibrio sp.]|nr:L-2-amino-thiazoline-4-carboxylic acid hydrolase [Desulfovibrio sp.]MBI4958519.1 L-2-amino-thiazoline-4-carboxylic acid hydrolase [Desulfovibrio sp.]